MNTTTRLMAATVLAALCFGATLAAAQDELLVSNVVAEPRAGTFLVDVTYDLETIDNMAVTVSLVLSIDGGATFTHPCTAVSGDIGEGVTPGVGKHVVWDAGADYPELSSPTCQLRVTADDGLIDEPEGFVTIPPGTFTMGSPVEEQGRYADEVQHLVTLTHSVYVQATEVTNQQYRDLAQWAYDQGYVTATTIRLIDNLDGSTEELLDLDGNSQISFSDGVLTVDAGKETCPVREVSWYGAVAYCDWLSLQQGLPRAYNHSTWACNGGDPYHAQGFRLPTEAEWEHTCRAGSTSALANGPLTHLYCEHDTNLDLIGWYCGNSLGETSPVAQKIPNAWALYDMHGNIYEWCNDFYGSYPVGAVTDPVGVETSLTHVLRGGSYIGHARNCRSARRHYDDAPESRYYIGFRPVMSAD